MPRRCSTWKWQLSAEAKGWKPKLERGGRGGFVEVVAATDGWGRSSRAEPSHEALEVCLSRGLRVRVPEGFDARTLRQLVAALEGD